MKEKFERFKNEKIVINVRSQKQYDDFMKICEEQGLKWSSVGLATSKNIYNWCKEETCLSYNFSVDDRLGYGDIRFYEGENWKVIKYKDFIKTKQFTKSDLKNNHIVVLRDKTKHIWKDFDFKKEFNNNLTHNADGKADIIEVYEFDKLVWKREEQILDEAEKEYLSYVIRPFKNNIIWIKKDTFNCNSNEEWIYIETNKDSMIFPNFKKGTMYKGLELDKKYTLKELGLDN